MSTRGPDVYGRPEQLEVVLRLKHRRTEHVGTTTCVVLSGTRRDSEDSEPGDHGGVSGTGGVSTRTGVPNLPRTPS